MKEQYEKLLLEPVSKVDDSSQTPFKNTLVLVDALDECESEKDIKTIIKLLSQTKSLTRLRFFVTSRPELSVRFGFRNIHRIYWGLIIHEVPKLILKRHLCIFSP